MSNFEFYVGISEKSVDEMMYGNTKTGKEIKNRNERISNSIADDCDEIYINNYDFDFNRYI